MPRQTNLPQDNLKTKSEIINDQIANQAPILDLQNHKLSKEEADSLAQWMESHPHPFLNVRGNASEKITQLIADNRKHYTDRASLYECIQLTHLSYDNSMHEMATKLPAGWEIMEIDGERAYAVDKASGYFGVAFTNHEKRLVIVAHRGTDGAVDWASDIFGLAFNRPHTQLVPAREFSRKVFEATKYRIGLVGHSLGGWLSLTCAEDLKAAGCSDSYVVAFDSPGVKKFLEKESNTTFRDQVFEEMDAAIFLSHVNVVNTCGEHIGKSVYYMQSDMKGVWFQWVMSHKMKYFLPLFKSDQTWPTRYEKVVQWKLDETSPLASFINSFFGRWRPNVWARMGQFESEPHDKRELDKAHFSALEWETLQALQKHDPSLIPDLPDKKLRDFKIKGRTLIAGEDGWEFRRCVHRLIKSHPEFCLKITHPDFFEQIQAQKELLRDLEDQFAKRDEIHSRLLKAAFGEINHSLYLFRPASESEIKMHQDQIFEIDQSLKKLENIKSQVSTLKAPKSLLESLDLGISKLNAAKNIHRGFELHKKRHFSDALSVVDKTISQVDDPTVLSRLYSLKGKIHRCLWKTENDLEKVKHAYETSLSYREEDRVHSNFGALLNDWGEWQLNTGIDSVAMQEEAMKHHKQAIYLNPVNEATRRDYARGLYLLGKGKYASGGSEEEYREMLEQAEAELSGLKADRNTLLFHGVVLSELAELGQLDKDQLKKALAKFEKGLEIDPTHPTLRARRARTLYLLDKNDAEKMSQAQKDITVAINNMNERTPITPEHTYRLAGMEQIKKEISGAQ